MIYKIIRDIEDEKELPYAGKYCQAAGVPAGMVYKDTPDALRDARNLTRISNKEFHLCVASLKDVLFAEFYQGQLARR